MEDVRKLPDVIGFGPCGVSMHLTLKISGGHEAIEYMKRYLPRPLDLDVRQECGLRLTAQIPLQKYLAPEMILTALLLIASAR